MKNFVLLLFLFISTTSFSQIEDLMSDPEVAWIGERTTDIKLDILHDEDLKAIFKQTNYNLEGNLEILNLQNFESYYELDGYYQLSKILFNAAFNKETKFYSDSLCSKLIRDDLPIIKIDTIGIIDPITFEEKLKVTLTKTIDPAQIKVFRIYQLISYRPKSGIWGTTTISIAPLISILDSFGNFEYLKPIFWMKVKNIKEGSKSKDITWSVKTNSEANHNIIIVENLKVLKSLNGFEKPLVHFLNFAQHTDKLPLFGINNWDKNYRVRFEKNSYKFKTENEIEEAQRSGTPINIDLIQNNFDDFNQMKFTEVWSWDNLSKNLSVQLLDLAPIKRIIDYDRGFEIKPLFYYRFDKK